MTRLRKKCPRCKGAGELRVVGWSTGNTVIVDKLIECDVCTGTGFDESAEAHAEEQGYE